MMKELAVINCQDKPRSVIQLFVMVITVLVLSACSSDPADSNGIGNSDPVNCNSPCLLETPTLDTNTIASATGGTVNVSFTIKGDIANVGHIYIYVEPVDSSSGAGRLTYVYIPDPTQTSITSAINISAGSVTGEYYLRFDIITPIVGEEADGAWYKLDASISATNYSFEETVALVTQNAVITDFVMPIITLTP